MWVKKKKTSSNLLCVGLWLKQDKIFIHFGREKKLHTAFASYVVTVFFPVNVAGHINLQRFPLCYTGKDFTSLLHTTTVNKE